MRGDEGATAVEFSFIVLPFILFVFGALDFGLFEYQQSQTNAAARDGERQAVLYANSGSGLTTVTTAAKARLGVATSGVNVTMACTNGLTGAALPSCTTAVPGTDTVTVTVTSAYQPLTPVLGQILGNRTIVSSSTQVFTGLPE